MTTFTNFGRERRSDVMRRAIAAGFTSLPVRDFTCGGRVLLEFRV